MKIFFGHFSIWVYWKKIVEFLSSAKQSLSCLNSVLTFIAISVKSLTNDIQLTQSLFAFLLALYLSIPFKELLCSILNVTDFLYHLHSPALYILESFVITNHAQLASKASKTADYNKDKGKKLYFIIVAVDRW